ncbi:MAG: (Glutamate--ammonia-ligase) adenylyltransferase [Frankiales bacterium]|nr:(Glutamate--ammonia-ligase) adenylyltransferase [Frankiales bacterium]
MSEATPGTERGATEEGRLVRLGFVDPGPAVVSLTDARLWADGEPAGEEAAVVVLAIGETPDPDLAASSLARLVAAVRHPEELLEGVREREGLRRRLLGVLGSSSALGDHLVAHPDDWYVLADDEVTSARPSLLGLQRQLLDAVGAPPDSPLPWGSGGARARGTGPDVIAALRAAYRRCLVALAARDLSGSMAVEDVAAELADLASATLSAGLAVALAELPEDLPGFRLAVVGMGKCGGRELNYVSDVDVIFVAEPLEGVAEGTALQTATNLASKAMQVCAEVAWPVDAGLRPEGRSGPLVRTLASHLAYYQRWAKTWEYQALVKARPIAGDLSLGQSYVDAVAPLVWSAGERPGFVEDVQAMRRRVESTLRGDTASREVKLGPGGLRDVEFSVQLLQLVHGRTDDTVRSGTTLVALEQLAAGGYVGREDARHLAEAYRWLRTVEHRLQLHRLRRTHLLPPDDDELALRRLARAVGYRGDVLALFRRERFGHFQEVRRLHEKLFYRPLLAAVARLPASDARLTPEAARERLVALGFADPATALRHLEALTEGVSRRAAIQQTLLPAMLGWFADAADPDAGLLSFRQVSDALGTTPWYLRLLRDEGTAAERLARLLASSRYAADLFVRAPDAVRMLASDEDLVPRSREALEQSFLAVARRREDWEPSVVAVRSLRRHELLRVACSDLLGLASGVGQALSDVSAATIAAALEVATRKVEAERRGPVPAKLAVIAMGRLGGSEQGYGSDADVLFVHDPLAGATESEAAAAAHDVAHELCRLLSLPAPDPPLLVDADLRPEGRQGPLTRSLESYQAYYGRWSHVWESQALLRAAPLAGDPEVTAAFLRAIEPVRYPVGGLTNEQLLEVRRIKARVEVERLPKGADRTLALKLGLGGLADVEWTVQLLQLQHGAELETLRTPMTLPALRAAAEAGLLTQDDAATLEAAWTLTSKVRDRLVLVRGRATVSLPSSGRELAGVARALGYPAGAQGEFLDDYRRVARRARAVVEKTFYG